MIKIFAINCIYYSSYVHLNVNYVLLYKANSNNKNNILIIDYLFLDFLEIKEQNKIK